MTAPTSPLSTALLIFGVFFLVAVPPLGIVLLIVAAIVHSNHRSRLANRRFERDRIAAKRVTTATEQRRADQASASRYFS